MKRGDKDDDGGGGNSDGSKVELLFSPFFCLFLFSKVGGFGPDWAAVWLPPPR